MQPLWWHTQSFTWSKGTRLTWTLLLTQYGDESSRLQSWSTDFLRNFLRMRKMQKTFINYSKSCERLLGFFLLHFFLWKVGFVFKGTSSWETAEYPILLLIQVLGMSHLQLLAFLPSLFLSHSEMLLFLPTLYCLIQGDSLYLRAFQPLN